MFQLFLFLLSIGICLEAHPLQLEFNFDDNIMDGIFVRIYTNRQYYEYPYRDAHLLLTSQYYDQQKPTVFYCHGWTESTNSSSTRTIITSYIERGGWNIVAFDFSILVHDYENFTGPTRDFIPAESAMLNYVSKVYAMEGLALSYIDSVRNSSRIGTAIGELLAKYVEEGMPLKTIHVVGHSLGGHIVSFIGKAFKQHFNNELRLPRITALDPAGPIFVLKFCPKLEKGDADMVDVIHTDTNLFGYPTNLGNVDYYPNMHLLMGGQPGCSNAEDGRIEGPGCSHYRSWKFYSESVLNPTAFPSVRCINKYAFLFNYCDNDSLTYMGYLYPDKGDGEYYLETGPRQPFGMEMDGIPNLPIEIYDFDEM